MDMWKPIINSLKVLVLLTVLTGLIYPLGMTGIAQVLFPKQANGSLLEKDGAVVGSRLIGQNFQSDKYFHSRPSAAGSDGYDAASSSGSNLGPTSQKLLDTVRGRRDTVRSENKLADNASVPGDLVLASASGLDPHITPAAAYVQAERVANARGTGANAVRDLINQHTESCQAGFLGEDRVNVLELNLALDGIQ
jgi:K+-transporting ATPase ATPase C chain